MVLWLPPRPFITNTSKNVLFIIGNWNAEVRSQELPGITGKFGLGVQNEAGKRLIQFCQENALVISNTLFQQHKRWLYAWASPDGQYWNQIDYVLCNWRWRSSIESAKTRLGTDCDADHELLVANFRLKLKKVEKTNGPLRYDLNQTSYNYTVKLTNRFKGLNLIDRMPRTMDGGSWHGTGGSDQNHSQEKRNVYIIWDRNWIKFYRIKIVRFELPYKNLIRFWLSFLFSENFETWLIFLSYW